eukprot:m.431227 g.431227  ORF g.431227 m.431227 type:complete len:87 (-) comp17273_c0_seq1:1345-1605(-)
MGPLQEMRTHALHAALPSPLAEPPFFSFTQCGPRDSTVLRFTRGDLSFMPILFLSTFRTGASDKQRHTLGKGILLVKPCDAKKVRL